MFMLVEHEVIRQLVELYGFDDGDGIFAPGEGRLRVASVSGAAGGGRL